MEIEKHEVKKMPFTSHLSPQTSNFFLCTLARKKPYGVNVDVFRLRNEFNSSEILHTHAFFVLFTVIDMVERNDLKLSL